MKSEHRHELETNVLAKHLDQWLARIQPYFGTIVGIIVVGAVAMFGWSLYSGAISSEKSAAWDAYNRAVAGMTPDLETLRESAEEFPGTKMKELADVTWADGQVWMATREYIYMRSAANEALDRAQSAYEGVLRTSSNPTLLNRSRLGLARIYEMRNDLDKARAEYQRVEGALAPIAEMRLERLDDPGVKATYDWLATAQPPRPRSPLGPGTPGQIPDFSVGDMTLPAAPGGAPQGASGSPSSSLDTLFEGINLMPPDDSLDRYLDEGDSTAPPAGAASTDEAVDEPPATTDDTTSDEPATDVPATSDQAPTDASPTDTPPQAAESQSE